MNDRRNDPERIVLESNQRLSDSLIWRRQRTYFDRWGVEAFRAVPHHVTNNPVIAHAYADVVLGLLRDQAQAGSVSASDPIYLIELGAGTGRFAYLFLKALSGMLAEAGLPRGMLRYVMTDFTPSNVAFWRKHEALQPFVAQGIVDFALFDAERDDRLTLMQSGVTLEPGSSKGPIVVVANYVFDSLAQDAFSIKNGQLFECLVSLSTTETDLDEAAPFQNIASTYSERPAPSSPFPEPEFNEILRGYQDTPGEAELLFPTSTLRCLRRLAALASGPIVLLTADKGEVEATLARGVGRGGIVVHGSISLSVNYHAIAEQFRRWGGFVLTPAQGQSTLSINMFISGQSATAYPETKRSYQRSIQEGGPYDLFALLQSVHHESLDFASLLSVIRASRCDPRVLQTCLSFLWTRLENASREMRSELQCIIHRTWENYYHIATEPRDLPFELGLLLHALGDYETALSFFEHSRRLYGDDPRTLWNIGLCHCRLGRLEETTASFAEAVRLSPGFQPNGALQYKDPLA